ncbi:MAG TPA: phosphoribosylformylglycinamidine synthase subunit PurQ [Thermomicrobiales bacterium]|nr:phosphoribosylformylglycinamidine synthase subunit PurQ [Thermomicrobiales bacterium]
MSNTPRVAVIGFPGSNGDHDALHALAHDVGVNAELIDYRATALNGIDAVVLPGGFSYGDALRAGAIARFAPIMGAVQEFARSGGPVLGICNGFQVLTEAHLLPGALLRNRTLKFHCHVTHVRLEDAESIWLSNVSPGEVLSLPIAHGEGSYYVDDETLARLEDRNQIAFRYVEKDGSLTDEANLNGSVSAIAGVISEAGNVLGLMPHPERATDPLTSNGSGLKILSSLLGSGDGRQVAGSNRHNAVR